MKFGLSSASLLRLVAFVRVMLLPGADAAQAALRLNGNCMNAPVAVFGVTKQALKITTAAVKVLNGQIATTVGGDDRYARLFLFLFGGLDAGRIQTVQGTLNALLDTLQNNPRNIGVNCEMFTQAPYQLGNSFIAQLVQQKRTTYKDGSSASIADPYTFRKSNNWIATYDSDGSQVTLLVDVARSNKLLLPPENNGRQPFCSSSSTDAAAVTGLQDLVLCLGNSLARGLQPTAPVDSTQSYVGQSFKGTISTTVIHELLHLAPHNFGHAVLGDLSALGFTITGCTASDGILADPWCTVALGIDCLVNGNTGCVTNPETIAMFATVAFIYNTFPTLDLFAPASILTWKTPASAPKAWEETQDQQINMLFVRLNIRQLPAGIQDQINQPARAFLDSIQALSQYN